MLNEYNFEKLTPLVLERAGKFVSEQMITPSVNLNSQEPTEDGVVTTVEFFELGRVIAKVKYLYRDGEWSEL